MQKCVAFLKKSLINSFIVNDIQKINNSLQIKPTEQNNNPGLNNVSRQKPSPSKILLGAVGTICSIGFLTTCSVLAYTTGNFGLCVLGTGLSTLALIGSLFFLARTLFSSEKNVNEISVKNGKAQMDQSSIIDHPLKSLLMKSSDKFRSSEISQSLTNFRKTVTTPTKETACESLPRTQKNNARPGEIEMTTFSQS